MQEEKKAYFIMAFNDLCMLCFCAYVNKNLDLLTEHVLSVIAKQFSMKHHPEANGLIR